MNFPEMSRKGDRAHVGGVARVADARVEHPGVAVEAHAARGISAEHAAASDWARPRRMSRLAKRGLGIERGV